MARPKPDIVEFFPLFAYPSRTLQMLESKFGVMAFVFYYKLLQVLATEDGHYYDARDLVDMEFLATKLSNDSDLVEKMLDSLSTWGKIDKELWDQKIIWYQGFVNTLQPVYKKRKRPLPTKTNVVNKLSNIIIVSGPETPVSGTETPVSVPETIKNSRLPDQPGPEIAQRKGKERKGEERKEAVLDNLNINNISKGDDDSKKIMSSSAFEKILETREAFKHKGMEAIDASTKEMILTVYAITKAKENVSGYLNQVKDNLEKGEGNFELIFLDVANFSRRELKKIKSSEVIVQSQNEQSNQEAGIQSYKDKLKKASQVLNNLPLDARESLRVKVADEYGQLANDLSKDTIERCMLETIIEEGI